MSKFFTVILPSLLAGGLLFGSALTEAQPVPPTPPTAPKPPKPPKPPKIKGEIHIDLGDLDDLVDEQIQNALEAIGDNDQIPPHVREALKQRLEKVRIKVKKRIAKIGPTDIDGLKVELGQMGEELGQEMEQFGKEMEKWGKDFEKKMEKQVEHQMKQKKIILKGSQDPWQGAANPHDPGDIDDLPDMDMSEMDSDDLDDAIKDIGSLGLDPTTKAQLKQLRVKSDNDVANAKRELDKASERLQKQLEKDGVTEQEIGKSIDEVTKLEGQIRKARIIAWVKARSLLDASQRKAVERAARGGRK